MIPCYHSHQADASPKSKALEPNVVLNVTLADAHDPATEATLPLFSPRLIDSVLADFVPYRTILLISYPGWKVGNQISIRSRTKIEIDPAIAEAMELR